MSLTVKTFESSPINDVDGEHGDVNDDGVGDDVEAEFEEKAGADLPIRTDPVSLTAHTKTPLPAREMEELKEEIGVRRRRE